MPSQLWAIIQIHHNTDAHSVGCNLSKKMLKPWNKMFTMFIPPSMKECRFQPKFIWLVFTQRTQMREHFQLVHRQWPFAPIGSLEILVTSNSHQ